MNIRNAKHTANADIDLEYEHPVYGWIPFLASPDDVELLGRELHALALSGAVAAYVPPAPDAREIAKAAREAAVAAIKVTTTAGNTFDGDEISQGRMARAVIALSTGLAPSVTWVLADNSVIQATAAELTEALVLAGQAQAAIWVIN